VPAHHLLLLAMRRSLIRNSITSEAKVVPVIAKKFI